MTMTLKQMKGKLDATNKRYNLLIQIIGKSPKLTEKIKKILKHVEPSFELEQITGSLESFNDKNINKS